MKIFSKIETQNIKIKIGAKFDNNENSLDDKFFRVLTVRCSYMSVGKPTARIALFGGI